MGKVAKGVGHALASPFKTDIKTTENSATPVGNAFAQSQANYANGGMDATLKALLMGQPGDPKSLEQYFKATPGQGMVQDPGQVNTGYDNPFQASSSYAPTAINSSFTAPQFQGAGITGPQQVAFNAPQFAQTQLQGVQTGFDTGILPQVQSNLGGYVAPTLQNVQPGMVGAQNFNFANAPGIVNPDAQRAVIAQMFGEQQNQDIADLRERFGNQGRSSGAQIAEAKYRAGASAQQGLALDDITRQNNNLFLQQRGQDLSQNDALNNFMLQQRGQDIQQNQFGAQTGLALNDQQIAASGQQNQFNLGASGQGIQAQGMNQQAAIEQMNANLKAMGMDNDAILAFNAQMMGNNNALNTFNQQNAQNSLQAQGMNQNANLTFNDQRLNAANQQNAFNQSNAQFGANFGQNAQQMNNQNAQAANAAMLQAMGMNIGQQQFGANFTQQGQNMNAQNAMQNQNMGNNFMNNQQQFGLGMMNQQSQAQQFALAQMMQNLRQSQQLGTPQAENVVSPGWGTQLLNAGAQVAGAYAGRPAH